MTERWLRKQQRTNGSGFWPVEAEPLSTQMRGNQWEVLLTTFWPSFSFCIAK